MLAFSAGNIALIAGNTNSGNGGSVSLVAGSTSTVTVAQYGGNVLLQSGDGSGSAGAISVVVGTSTTATGAPMYLLGSKTTGASLTAGQCPQRALILPSPCDDSHYDT